MDKDLKNTLLWICNGFIIDFADYWHRYPEVNEIRASYNSLNELSDDEIMFVLERVREFDERNNIVL